MEKNYKSLILDKIYSVSGIVIAPIHSIAIFSFVEKQLQKMNISIDEYYELLDKNPKILNELINQATTNETYFFREEKQFDYLKNVLFPKYKYKKLVIWSAACSTGEEPLSLLALAMEFNIKVEIYASDIDDNVLTFFKNGEYSRYSFRKDGEKYHHYLYKLGEFNADKTKFKFRSDVINKVKIIKYNLKDFCNFPIHEKIDLIFMRNVFIYFDMDTRTKITEEVTKQLNENGHLFYSINEIGNINGNIVPSYMKKNNYNLIYYYVKQTEDEKKELNKDVILVKPCEIFTKICYAIVRKDFLEAFNIAENYNPSFSEQYYSSFFKGYVLMNQNNFIEAERYFTTTEFMKDEFWPVYYFHGILLKYKGLEDKSINYFKKCYLIMQKYIENQSVEYDFILRNTNPKNVYSYCSKIVEGEISGN